MNARHTAIVAVAILGMAALIGGAVNPAEAGTQQAAAALSSQYVATPPQVDGVVDAMWDAVPEVNVSAFGGANTGNHTIALKSVYTNDRIYFLARWNDPTLSLRRFPWVKQDDGSWAQLMTTTNHDETQFYEDKLAILWNMNNSISGFNEAGCAVTCHAGEAGKAFGNMYTQTGGEMGDMWHWKSVRTNPEGYADDKYMNDTRFSEDNEDAGRHADPRDGGSYVNNKNDAGTMPAFMGPVKPMPPEGPYWIKDSEKMPFVDTFEPGDEVPGILVSRALGDRGDIEARGVYGGDGWTLELSRELVTGSEFDIQFDDLSADYFFGVAVFDNAQVRHSWQNGVSMLQFAPKPTAVDPTSWAQIKEGVAGK